MHEVCVLSAAYAAWAAGDLGRLAALIADDIVFDVNMPARTESYLGCGQSKVEFLYRMRNLLDDWAVLAFKPEWIKPRGPLWQCVHVSYCYEERRTGLKIDGTMRNLCRVVDGKVRQLELLVDAGKHVSFRRLTRAELAGIGPDDALWPVRC
jgi:ketosteroid isomerase-like protein